MSQELLRALTPDPASSIRKKLRQTAISICSGLSHPTQQVQIRKKCAKRPLLSAASCHTQPSKFKFEKKRQKAITICSELSHPTQQVQIRKKCANWPLLSAAAAVTPDWNISRLFSRAEKSSEDITRCLFLKNMKWLNNE
jgi:hypothetical protein